MSNTISGKKLRAVSVASAIFIVGGGMGWQAAEFMFKSEAPTPMLSAIRFEGNQPPGPLGKVTAAAPRLEPGQQPGHAHPMMEDDRHPADGPARQSEEERRSAEALEWAEKYRHRQAGGQDASPRQRLAAAEALRWAEVAEHARHIEQPRMDWEKLAQAQDAARRAHSNQEQEAIARQRLAAAEALRWAEVAEHARHIEQPRMEWETLAQAQDAQQNGNSDRVPDKAADAASTQKGPRLEILADLSVTHGGAPVAQCAQVCEDKSVRKQGDPARARLVHRARVRSHRAGVGRGGAFLCPLGGWRF
jgi:hypothetical protein